MGLIFSSSQGCSAQDKPDTADRKPAVAGRFYPGDAGELKQMLAGFFASAKPRTSGQVAAVVCPHAGYVFSGQVAASGINQVDPERSFDHVFVIASSHMVYFPGASIYNRGDYLTPLGKVPVDRELADLLIRQHDVFTYRPEADRTEHSLEVQIPFLQYHLKKPFRLVPIVLGTQSASDCSKIAEALKPYFNDHNLFVFSSDFAHYPSYSDAVATDKATCDAIVSGSAEKLTEFLSQYKRQNIANLVTNLCGWTSVLVMLGLTGKDPAYSIIPVQYMNSGDTRYGDKEQVVGYWSLAVTRSGGSTDRDQGFLLTHREKARLLSLARQTIATYLHDRRVPGDRPEDYPGNLAARTGAFVTLKENGQLRGCIGRFSADLPLYRLVREMAVASATEDYRFEPVREDELKEIEIEISVLTPMKRISSPGEIILGKHGIYIKKGSSSGTFLPQVATETGWTVEEFLGHCSRDKAGLGWDGWKNAEVFTYEALVFSESEINGGKD